MPFLDIFEPVTRQLEKQICSVQVPKKTVKEMGIFQEGKPTRTDRLIYIFKKRLGGGLNTLVQDEKGRNWERAIVEQLKALAKKCTDTPIRENNFICLRPHKQEKESQCLAFVPLTKEGNLAIIGNIVEYTADGIRLQDLNTHPDQVTWVQLQNEWIALDSGIAAQIKRLNEDGYVTFSSHSGLAADHYGIPTLYGKLDEGLIAFTFPVPLSTAHSQAIQCIKEATMESGNYNWDLGKASNVNTGETDYSIHTIFPVPEWKSLSPEVYDKRVREHMQSFDQQLQKMKCRLLLGEKPTKR